MLKTNGQIHKIHTPTDKDKRFNIGEKNLCRFRDFAEGKITLSPVQAPKYTLEELLNGITKNNLHTETDTKGAKGKEIW